MVNAISHPYQMIELHFNLRVGGWYFTFFNSNRTLCKQKVQNLLRFGCTIGVAPITQYTHVRDKYSNTQGRDDLKW